MITLQFIFLDLTSIILFLTFGAICWYSYETRRLVQLSAKTFLIQNYQNIFAQNIEKQHDDVTNNYIAGLPKKIERLVEEIEKM